MNFGVEFSQAQIICLKWMGNICKPRQSNFDDVL